MSDIPVRKHLTIIIPTETKNIINSKYICHESGKIVIETSWKSKSNIVEINNVEINLN